MLVHQKATVALLTGDTVIGRAVIKNAEIELLVTIHFAEKNGT